MHRALLLLDARRFELGDEFGDRAAVARIDVLAGDFGQRHEIEGPLGDIRVRNLEAAEIAHQIVDVQNIDIDRPGADFEQPLATDRSLDRTHGELERRGLELRRDRGGDIEKRRPQDAQRRRLVIRRDRRDARERTHFLQCLQNRALPVA